MTRKLRLLTAAALALASSSAFAAPIRVMSAIYGTPEAARTCNATGPIAGMCDGRGSCDVYSGNQLCSDPNVYVVKSISIKYLCNKSIRTTWAREYSIARMACE